MYCSKCGNKLNEGDKFCPNCGEAVLKNDGFTPAFKLEAKEEVKDKDVHVEWNWDLSGFDNSGKKDTEPAVFDWSGIVDPSLRPVKAEKIEPNKDLLFQDRAFVERATAELELSEVHKKAKDLRDSYSEASKNESHSDKPFDDLISIVKNMEEEKPLSIEDLEKEIFSEMKDEEDDGWKKESSEPMFPTDESKRFETMELLDKTIIAEHFDKEEPEEEKEKFYTYNQKIDAFDELLAEAKEKVPCEEPIEKKNPFQDFAFRFKREKIEIEEEEEDTVIDEIFKAKEETSVSHIEEEIVTEAVSIEHSPKHFNTGVLDDIFGKMEEPKEEPVKSIEEEFKEVEELEVPEIPEIKMDEELSSKIDELETELKKETDETTAFFDNAESYIEKPKKHIFAKFIIGLLIALLVLEAGVVAIKLIAPDSTLSEKTNVLLLKVIDRVAGREEVETPDVKEELDTYLESVLADKASDLKTVGSFVYNRDLDYSLLTEHAFTEEKSSSTFIDCDWYQDDSGKTITYSEKIFEIYVKYFENWQSINKNEDIVGINKVSVGEIKSGENGFYVLTEVEYAMKGGTVSSELETVYLKAVNKALVVSEIRKETK